MASEQAGAVKMARSPVCKFLHEITLADVPPAVIQHLKVAVKDLIASAAAGTRTPLAAVARSYSAKYLSAPSESRLLFNGRRTSMAGSALASAMTFDAIDIHDGHNIAKGHAGAPSLAALLAIADAVPHMTGEEFLIAMLVGYEVGLRAGCALHALAKDYHASGTWAAVGVAALTARSFGLNEGQTAQALGISEFHAPRSPIARSAESPTMVKDGLGWGTLAGLSAAQLALEGFSGPPAETCTSMEVSDIWASLGTRWYILESYFRLWPACRMAHPAIEAAMVLRAEPGFDHAQIESIDVVAFDEALKLKLPTPRSLEEAQYSLPFSVAAALVKGVSMQELKLSQLSHSDILRLAAGVRITSSTEFSALWPARRQSRISLKLKNGQTRHSPVMEARGDPERPYEAAELSRKFDSLLVPYVGAERAQEIRSSVDDIECGGVQRLLNGLLSDPRQDVEGRISGLT